MSDAFESIRLRLKDLKGAIVDLEVELDTLQRSTTPAPLSSIPSVPPVRAPRKAVRCTASPAAERVELLQEILYPMGLVIKHRADGHRTGLSIRALEEKVMVNVPNVPFGLSPSDGGGCSPIHRRITVDKKLTCGILLTVGKRNSRSAWFALNNVKALPQDLLCFMLLIPEKKVWLTTGGEVSTILKNYSAWKKNLECFRSGKDSKSLCMTFAQKDTIYDLDWRFSNI